MEPVHSRSKCDSLKQKNSGDSASRWKAGPAEASEEDPLGADD